MQAVKLGNMYNVSMLHEVQPSLLTNRPGPVQLQRQQLMLNFRKIRDKNRKFKKKKRTFCNSDDTVDTRCCRQRKCQLDIARRKFHATQDVDIHRCIDRHRSRNNSEHIQRCIECKSCCQSRTIAEALRTNSNNSPRNGTHCNSSNSDCPVPNILHCCIVRRKSDSSQLQTHKD